jgi:hypothetical protein
MNFGIVSAVKNILLYSSQLVDWVMNNDILSRVKKDVLIKKRIACNVFIMRITLGGCLRDKRGCT